MLGQLLLSHSVSQSSTLKKIQGNDVPATNVITTLHLWILIVSYIARKLSWTNRGIWDAKLSFAQQSLAVSCYNIIHLADRPTVKNQRAYSERQDAI